MLFQQFRELGKNKPPNSLYELENIKRLSFIFKNIDKNLNKVISVIIQLFKDIVYTHTNTHI